MAYKSSRRGTSPVIWIAGHTAEGARTKESLAAYFYRDDIQASSHVAIDAGGILSMVPYDRAAWTLRGGNPISDNAELCGFARWTRAQWLSTGTVDGCANPRQMLRNYAAWTRSRCLARGIPIRKLTVSQVAAKQAGIIHHADYTNATGDGTHWDMGTGIPWDVVLSDIAAMNPKEEEDMQPGDEFWASSWTKEGTWGNYHKQRAEELREVRNNVREIETRLSSMESKLNQIITKLGETS
jgi:hypothetical protein